MVRDCVAAQDDGQVVLDADGAAAMDVVVRVVGQAAAMDVVVRDCMVDL